MHGSRIRRGSLVAVLGSMLGLALGATPMFGADSGGVDAQVTVSPAAACIELNTSSIGFGTLALGAENQSGTPGINISNCGDADATLMASGTNAAGTGAAWNLVDDGSTCAIGLGLDNYHLSLAGTAGDQIATLSTENKEVGTLLAAGGTSQVARISTACPGSSGAGKVMSMQINYLATTIVAPPIVLQPLTVDQATADSAAAFLLPSNQNVGIAPKCSGDPIIACPGGVPSDPAPQVQVQASNVLVQRVPGTDTWAGSSTLQAATLQGIVASFSGVTCTVTVNTATVGSPTVSGSWLQTFASYPLPTGQPNYIAVTNVDVTGLDDGDIQFAGGFSCSIASALVGLIKPQLESQVEASIAGNLCGTPDPATWLACPPLP